MGHELRPNGAVVVSDHQDVWYTFAVEESDGEFSIAMPGIVLLAPGMEIVKMSEPTIEEIEQVLPGNE